MSTLVPYHKIAEDDSKYEFLGATFELDTGDITLTFVDYYCTNPECDCNHVWLELVEGQDGKLAERVVSFFLDFKTWKMSDIKVGKRAAELNINVDRILFLFTQIVDAKMKRTYKSHYRLAKQYRETEDRFQVKKVSSDIDPSQIKDGIGISYSQVFPNEPEWLTFEYKGRQYLIDDQYCMNPSCTCNEVFLNFVIHDKGTNEAVDEFAVRFSLGKFEYEILEARYSENEVASIMDTYLKKQNDNRLLLKRRYNAMKAKGKDLLFEHRKTLNVQAENENAARVGRNDPCPCGSGKKYKKCCGQSI